MGVGERDVVSDCDAEDDCEGVPDIVADWLGEADEDGVALPD